MLVSIVVRELGEDFHQLFLLGLYLNVNHKVLVEVARIESRVGGENVVHCVVFPGCFLAVRTVDWNVRARRGWR